MQDRCRAHAFSGEQAEKKTLMSAYVTCGCCGSLLADRLPFLFLVVGFSLSLYARAVFGAGGLRVLAGVVGVAAAVDISPLFFVCVVQVLTDHSAVVAPRDRAGVGLKRGQLHIWSDSCTRKFQSLYGHLGPIQHGTHRVSTWLHPATMDMSGLMLGHATMDMSVGLCWVMQPSTYLAELCWVLRSVCEDTSSAGSLAAIRRRISSVAVFLYCTVHAGWTLFSPASWHSGLRRA